MNFFASKGPEGTQPLNVQLAPRLHLPCRVFGATTVWVALLYAGAAFSHTIWINRFIESRCVVCFRSGGCLLMTFRNGRASISSAPHYKMSG